LLSLVTLIGIGSVSDYGRSWDETFRFQGGDAKLAYYKAFFVGEAPTAPMDSYPGLFDLPLAWAHEQFPEWGTRSQKGHVWSLSFGFLGLLSAWRLTARIGGERAGFWALLLLTTLPRYYGHMFFNPKDIPLAGTYALGLWALVCAFSHLPQVRAGAGLWVGLTAGLALSTRIAGFLILFYFGLFIGLYLLLRYLQSGRNFDLLKRELWRWLLRGASAGLVAFLLVFVFWPMLHSNPLNSLMASTSEVQNFGWDAQVLVNGAVYAATDLPRSYLPYWMARTIPGHILLLIGVAFAVGTYDFPRSRNRLSGLHWAAMAVAFAAVFPLVYILWSDPVLYDGMRHALFILPPFVCVAALGLEWCLRRFSEFWTRLMQSALAVLVLLVVWEMISLHPYQYIYFNQITGGLQSAYLHDETDYWGLSHKEAAEWLEAQSDPERVYTVHLLYNRYMLKEHLDPMRFRLSPEAAGSDYFVAVTRFGFYDDYPEAQLLHVVERQGVPLCFVFALSGDLKTKGN
jgi:hypothetical protein